MGELEAKERVLHAKLKDEDAGLRAQLETETRKREELEKELDELSELAQARDSQRLRAANELVSHKSQLVDRDAKLADSHCQFLDVKREMECMINERDKALAYVE